MVGVEDLPFAPQYSLDGEGQYRGFAREVLDAFASDSGISLSYKALPVDQLLPALQRGEISPGKNALLLCTTAGSTPLRLDHQSFAVSCPLALLHSAFYPVLVHRLADYAPRFLPTFGHPHAVALHFVRCDQLTAGLAPAGVRPCWAHKKKGEGRERPSPFLPGRCPYPTSAKCVAAVIRSDT